MSHPLLDRLVTDLGWPRLGTDADAVAWTARPGVHVLFVPGDPGRNLETADVAVILPELVQAFQGRFDCALVDNAIEARVRERAGVLKTPSLIVYREGVCLGGIARVRDWDDYLARLGRFLQMSPATV